MMNPGVNITRPLMMHIDLNSCFATIEQQAHLHLRGKPVVVAAYKTENAVIVSPSIEAKRYGIKVGMRVKEARLLCKDIVVRQSDPSLARDVHVKFRKIFNDYTPHVTPKSIDEAILDFTSVESMLNMSLQDIGKEIKLRMRREIGEWISCSVGIGTNRFLAKVAAGVQKPDGLITIDYKNLLDTYKKLTLVDLPGINTRFEVRLNVMNIMNPVDFFYASLPTLKNQVFQSIGGYYWYQRLRGWEVDDVDFDRKSYGHEYSLRKKTNDMRELRRILMKLCEKMGRRLRGAGYVANGVHVACRFDDRSHWHMGKKSSQCLFTTQELFKKVMWVFNQRPDKYQIVTKISVSCFDLEKNKNVQISLFEMTLKDHDVQVAVDNLNDRYGEFVVKPALMLGTGKIVIDRISFGNVKELESLYD